MDYFIFVWVSLILFSYHPTPSPLQLQITTKQVRKVWFSIAPAVLSSSSIASIPHISIKSGTGVSFHTRFGSSYAIVSIFDIASLDSLDIQKLYFLDFAVNIFISSSILKFLTCILVYFMSMKPFGDPSSFLTKTSKSFVMSIFCCNIKTRAGVYKPLCPPTFACPQIWPNLQRRNSTKHFGLCSNA